MNFFEQMNQALQGFDVNIIIAKNHDTPDGLLTLSILPKAVGDLKLTVAPFTMVATPEYLDANFEELFKAPQAAVIDLFAVSKKYADEATARTAEAKKKADEAKAAKGAKAATTVTGTNTATLELKKTTPAFDKLMLEAEKQTAMKNWKFAKMYLDQALKLCPLNEMAKTKLGAIDIKLKEPAPFDLFAGATASTAAVDIEANMKAILLTPDPESTPTVTVLAEEAEHDESDIPEDEDAELVEADADDDDLNNPNR